MIDVSYSLFSLSNSCTVGLLSGFEQSWLATWCRTIETLVVWGPKLQASPRGLQFATCKM